MIEQHSDQTTKLLDQLVQVRDKAAADVATSNNKYLKLQAEVGTLNQGGIRPSDIKYQTCRATSRNGNVETYCVEQRGKVF